ncbi:putative methyltransferase DDB_G0268948 [Oppia nitens]|uniref:putative methyltransferase DDB_G0268948 n=1 Tax=Oppia nitens TaxID=1686743 RepID=UPI0023DBA829|nr:putative methyltransferase DDB_G0268948 [Oppia nitens]
MSIRLFESIKHANIYAKYRATVADNVIKAILEYLGHKLPTNQWDTVVDVGCGTGQGTNSIAPYFKHCYGFDVSAAQIKVAKESPHADNVQFEVCPAESLPSITANSVQLVTAFQCVHFIDFDKFIDETSRVLADNGVLALVGNQIGDTIDPCNPDDRTIAKLVYDTRRDPRMMAYNHPNRSQLENYYRDYKFPANYEYHYLDNITATKTVTAADILGRIESASRYQSLASNEPQTAKKLSQEFTDNLKSLLKCEDLSAKQLTMNYNYFIAMGRKISN